MVALAGVYRYDSGEIDPRLAKSEANVLHTAIKDKVVKHDEITRIVGTRSKAQLIATFNCYKDEYGASITKVEIGYCFRPWFVKGLSKGEKSYENQISKFY